MAALDGTKDEKLTGLALRIVLLDHIGLPQDNQPDLLTEAEEGLAPKKPKVAKAKATEPETARPATASPHQRSRRHRRKLLSQTYSGPGQVRGRFVSGRKSRRETPLRFLPDPLPVRPTHARRLRGRSRVPPPEAAPLRPSSR